MTQWFYLRKQRKKTYLSNSSFHFVASVYEVCTGKSIVRLFDGTTKRRITQEYFRKYYHNGFFIDIVCTSWRQSGNTSAPQLCDRYNRAVRNTCGSYDLRRSASRAVPIPQLPPVHNHIARIGGVFCEEALDKTYLGVDVGVLVGARVSFHSPAKSFLAAPKLCRKNMLRL